MQTIAIHFPINISFKLNFKLILTTVFCLTVFLLGFYLYQIGQFTHSNYLINDYQKDIEDVSSKNAFLLDQSTEILGLASVEQTIVELGFVKVLSVRYLPMPEKLLSKKNP